MASPFFKDGAKTLVVEAVRDVESKTSAEVVVSVRGQVDAYRDIDLIVGAIGSLLAFAVLIFHPAELDADLMPFEALAAFLVGSLLVAKIGPVKRRLLSKKRRSKRVLEAARATFMESGVDRTRDRSGVLVFVALFERELAIVPDRGIDPAKLGPAWDAAAEELRASVRRSDPAAFASALRTLGEPLGRVYPRKHDDTNELPDAPDVVAS